MISATDKRRGAIESAVTCSTHDPRSLTSAIRHEISQLDPDLPAANVRALEQLALQRGAQRRQLRLGRGELRNPILRRLLDLRARELEQHGVRLHTGAGADDNLVYPRLGARRDPANLFRHQRAEAAHWRTIGPRFTVSIQTVDRSTLGTAGFRRESPKVAAINPSTTSAIVRIRFCRFFFATPARGTSMALLAWVNPLGRNVWLRHAGTPHELNCRRE